MRRQWSDTAYLEKDFTIPSIKYIIMEIEVVPEDDDMLKDIYLIDVLGLKQKTSTTQVTFPRLCLHVQ